MSNTIQEIIGGDSFATSYNGSGIGLTNIPRSAINNGTANNIIVNDGTGALSSVAFITPALGGTGINTSSSSGLARVNNGTWLIGSTVTDADISNSAAISRNKLANGTANSVITNDTNGVLSSTTILPTTLGGTGVNLGLVSGPAIVSVSSGAVATTLTYGTGATSNIIVQRDNSGNIPTLGNTAATLITCPTYTTASGNLNIGSAGGSVLFGTQILTQTPTTVAGGFASHYTTNIQTTNATAANLFTLPTLSGTKGTIYSIRVHISAGDNTGGSNTGSITYYLKAKNLIGTLTLSSIAGRINNIDNGFNINIGVVTTTTNIQFQVIGIASTIINWIGHFEVIAQQF